MALKTNRRIRDNMHGTVELTDLEDAVLSHPHMQRLRRIKQLAFLQYVFPGASHSRFEHSLGTLHLASIAWNRLRRNQTRLREQCRGIQQFEAREKEFVHGLLAPSFAAIEDVFQNDHTEQAFRLAALLHDVGHSPFSHSGERFLPSWQAVHDANPGIPDYMRSYLTSMMDQYRAKGRDPAKIAVRHEVFSLLIVGQIMRDVQVARPDLVHADLAQDISSIIVGSIPPAPGSPLRQHGAFRLCHDLVTGELDVDRMDYLLRDSRECGVVYGIFDADRILDSLACYYNEEDEALHTAIHFAGLAAFEDYLRARQSMYIQLYFHKTGVACEAMMQKLSRLLGGWHFPAAVDAYAAIDEYNVEHVLDHAAMSTLDDEQMETFRRILHDLLLQRHLWKRVFEVSGTRQHPASLENIEKAKAFLAKHKEDYEQVSSASALTRLNSRPTEGLSQNTMRLIKKDEFRFPRVLPVEDYTRLVREDHFVEIHRLYVENKVDADGKASCNSLRDQMNRELFRAK